MGSLFGVINQIPRLPSQNKYLASHRTTLHKFVTLQAMLPKLVISLRELCWTSFDQISFRNALNTFLIGAPTHFQVGGV